MKSLFKRNRKNRKRNKNKNKNVVEELNFNDIDASQYVYTKSEEEIVEKEEEEKVEEKIEDKDIEIILPFEVEEEENKIEEVIPKIEKKEIKSKSNREINYNPSKSYTIRCIFPSIIEKKVIDFAYDDNNSILHFIITQNSIGKITIRCFSKTDGVLKIKTSFNLNRFSELLINVKIQNNAIILVINKKEKWRKNCINNILVDKIKWNSDNINIF